MNEPERTQLDLAILPQRLAICRLAGGARLPAWAQRGAAFLSVTRTPDELSIVIDQDAVPDELECLRGYRAFRVAGTMDPNLVGILASLTGPLATAGVPIFAVSTHDTDFLLVREIDLERATRALHTAGHRTQR
jgi:hypothetical protein